jgi:two-component system, chemotaxis family, chemotaxis protein CheY
MYSGSNGRGSPLSCILIVEDDRVVREVVSDALVDAGYAVAKAADGADALDQLREHPADAILLDLMMPVMDGWMFLDAISQDKELCSIPVGIMSAVPALRRAAQEQGVQVTVGKPFAVDDLLAQVECLLSEMPSRPR